MELGTIKINNEVIAGIAGKAALQIDGVARLSGGIREGIAKLLTGEQASKGVKVKAGREECVIDISLSVEYGVKIFDVCFNVQKAVKDMVFQMTGLKCVEVNIFVESVEEASKKIDLK